MGQKLGSNNNISALALASNPIFHAQFKHIEVDYHFVREKVANKDIVFNTFPPLYNLQIYLLRDIQLTGSTFSEINCL